MSENMDGKTENSGGAGPIDIAEKDRHSGNFGESVHRIGSNSDVDESRTIVGEVVP